MLNGHLYKFLAHIRGLQNAWTFHGAGKAHEMHFCAFTERASFQTVTAFISTSRYSIFIFYSQDAFGPSQAPLYCINYCLSLMSKLVMHRILRRVRNVSNDSYADTVLLSICKDVNAKLWRETEENRLILNHRPLCLPILYIMQQL